MNYTNAKKMYSKIGVDVEKAITDLSKISISLHCWQGDDVTGFETVGGASGGIQTTGNYPGKANTPEELMAMKGKYYKLVKIQSMAQESEKMREEEMATPVKQSNVPRAAP